MQTIVKNVEIKGIVREVTFTQLDNERYEISAEKQPKLTIKPYPWIFPIVNQKYCATYQNAIVIGKSPAEVFEKAVDKYWDNQVAIKLNSR